MIDDVETGYGWTLSGGLVAAFVVVSCGTSSSLLNTSSTSALGIF